MSHSPEIASGEISGSFSDFLMETDEECELPIKEEMIEKVMQELYDEITSSSECSNPPNVSPSSDVPASEMSPATSQPRLLVDKGKNGSCGAAVSDNASSVMAGVEFVGTAGGKKSWSENGVASGEGGHTGEDDVGDFGEMMDGCDGVEFDDEWLDGVLSWGPPDDECDVGQSGGP